MTYPWLERLIPPHIREFEPYSPSKPDRELKHLYGLDHLHRLNNNENSLGPSPGVRKILHEFSAPAVPIYPNGDSFDLRNALAERFNKTPDHFLIGNGSCEIITSAIKALCSPGDNVITADKTFAVYEWVATFSGCEARLIPLKNFGFDPQGMLDAADDRTKIIFVCNPNNPTGTYWDKETMTRFLDAVNERYIVVIDEAYFEYVEQEDYPDAMELMATYPNVVTFRTFSKMYALAACRIGYLCAHPDIVHVIRRAHIVYSVNTLAQMTALAALKDETDFITRTRQLIAQDKTMLARTCDTLELPMVSGEGNYVMINVPVADTLIYRRLMKKGFMVRTMTGFRFPNWIRVSMGHPEVMEAFCKALGEVVTR